MASDTKTVYVQRGLGLPMVLFLIFLVLQLCGTIDWPWYAIAAPLLISWGIFAMFGVFAWVLMLVAAVATARRS